MTKKILYLLKKYRNVRTEEKLFLFYVQFPILKIIHRKVVIGADIKGIPYSNFC